MSLPVLSRDRMPYLEHLPCSHSSLPLFSNNPGWGGGDFAYADLSGRLLQGRDGGSVGVTGGVAVPKILKAGSRPLPHLSLAGGPEIILYPLLLCSTTGCGLGWWEVGVQERSCSQDPTVKHPPVHTVHGMQVTQVRLQVAHNHSHIYTQMVVFQTSALLQMSCSTFPLLFSALHTAFGKAFCTSWLCF